MTVAFCAFIIKVHIEASGNWASLHCMAILGTILPIVFKQDTLIQKKKL